MTVHLSAALLQASATVLPLAVVVAAPLTGLTLRERERSALTYRAVVAVGLAVGLASLVGRLPLDLTTYAALAAALLVPLRPPLGSGLLLVAILGALARGDLEVHQRPVVLGGLLVGVLAAVVGTLLWQELDPLPEPQVVRRPTAGRTGWAQLFAPSPIDLDHLDAIIDGTLDGTLDDDASPGRPAAVQAGGDGATASSPSAGVSAARPGRPVDRTPHTPQTGVV